MTASGLRLAGAGVIRGQAASRRPRDDGGGSQISSRLQQSATDVEIMLDRMSGWPGRLSKPPCFLALQGPTPSAGVKAVGSESQAHVAANGSGNEPSRRDSCAR